MKIDVDFFVESKEKIWFINTESDGLFSIGKGSRKVTFHDVLPCGIGFRKYCSGINIGRYLIFFPYFANCILVYDIITNTFEEIHDDSVFHGDSQYSICFAYDDNVYAISTYGEAAILVLDIETKQVEKHLFDNSEWGGLGRDFILQEGNVYLPFLNKSSVLVINLQNSDIRATIRDINVNENGFGTICYANSSFWLSSEDAVYQADKSFNKVRWFCQYPINMSIQNGTSDTKEHLEKISVVVNQPFWRSFEKEGKLYLVSALANMSLCICLQTKEIWPINLEDDDSPQSLIDYPLSERISILKHLSAIVSGNDIFFSLSRNHSLNYFDMKNCKSEQISVCLEEKDLLRIISNRKVVEEGIVGLSFWIENLIDKVGK